MEYLHSQVSGCQQDLMPYFDMLDLVNDEAWLVDGYDLCSEAVFNSFVQEQ